MLPCSGVKKLKTDVPALPGNTAGDHSKSSIPFCSNGLPSSKENVTDDEEEEELDGEAAEDATEVIL